MKVRAGDFHLVTPTGSSVIEPTTPDVWMCRRVTDFPEGKIPAAAGYTECARCGVDIVFNTARKFPNALKVCMQCEGIEPEPIP